MPGEGITPPQGYGNGPDKSRFFYGLPMSMPTGGAGTRVSLVIKMPPQVRSGAGGTTARIEGDLIPFVPAPLYTKPPKPQNGGGMRIKVETRENVAFPAVSGARAFIIPIPVIVVKSGSGTAAGTAQQ